MADKATEIICEYVVSASISEARTHNKQRIVKPLQESGRVKTLPYRDMWK